MAGTPGRNDPCPCGSGRKYKRCCLRKHEGSRESLRVRLRRAEQEAVSAVLSYVARLHGPDFLHRAWEAFFGKMKEPMSQDHPEFEGLFIPWFVTCWNPSPRRRGVEQPPLGWMYLEEQGHTLNDFQRRFLEALLDQPFSFFQVRHVQAGEAITLRDVFLEHEVVVMEKTASQSLHPGDIIYGRVIPLDGGAILSGTASLVIPPSYLDVLIDMRESLKGALNAVTPEILHTIEPQLREMYLTFRENLLNPEPPRLQNTDGEPFVFVTLRYDLTVPPREAVEKLASLSFISLEEIMSEADVGPDGSFQKVEMTWAKPGNRLHKAWDNTILGHIRIEPGKMVVEVNSKKRAAQIRKEILRRLGDSAVLSGEETKGVEEVLAEKRGRPETEEERKAREESRMLSRHPEARAFMEEMFRKHWAAWLDERIPALKGMTPREAARTSEGRERLEALLFDFDAKNRIIEPDDPLVVDVGWLRAELGLQKR